RPGLRALSGKRLGQAAGAAALFACALLVLAATRNRGQVAIPAFLSGLSGQEPASSKPAESRRGAPAADLRTDSSAERTVVGSGVPATRSWDVRGFTAIQIRSAFRAEIRRAEEFRVNTTADDNIIEHIQVEKEGATLTIRLAPNRSYHFKSAPR